MKKSHVERLLSSIWGCLADFYLEPDESMELKPIEFGSSEIKVNINGILYIVTVIRVQK